MHYLFKGNFALSLVDGVSLLPQLIIILILFYFYLLVFNSYYVIFVLCDKQPLSATNFLYELDKMTQEIVTVSNSQLEFSKTCTTACSFATSSLFIYNVPNLT